MDFPKLEINTRKVCVPKQVNHLMWFSQRFPPASCGWAIGRWRNNQQVACSQNPVEGLPSTPLPKYVGAHFVVTHCVLLHFKKKKWICKLLAENSCGCRLRMCYARWVTCCGDDESSEHAMKVANNLLGGDWEIIYCQQVSDSNLQQIIGFGGDVKHGWMVCDTLNNGNLKC